MENHTLRLIETEEALQSVTQQEAGRPLPSWIRDIAGGLDGREGFRALKEAVVGMQRELEELRTQAANAPAAPAAPPVASAAAVHEEAVLPTPEEAYTEAAGAIEERDRMMASVMKMREELEVEREKRQAANSALRTMEEKLASGGPQENIKDMSERIRTANNRADEESKRADEERGKRKELEREIRSLKRALEKEESEHSNTKQLVSLRQKKIETLEDQIDRAERRLDSADLGRAAATMREDLIAANDRIKEMEETIRKLEEESRTRRARSRSSRGRGRSESGSRSSGRSSSGGSPRGVEREASPCSATPIGERDAEDTEPKREGTTADAGVDPTPATSESVKGAESREEPTQGDDEPRPMNVDDEGGEAKAKKERKGIFPSPIDGPEDDQIHITATGREVRGVANLIGYPALVKTARDWPVNEAVAALTDEEREKTDRGHPPYHRMEYAHSDKPSSSSTALFGQDVTDRVDDMKFPERPEGIEDWQYAFTEKRGSMSRLADTREDSE